MTNAHTATATAAGMMLAYATSEDAGSTPDLILMMDRAELARTLLAAVQLGGTLITREAEELATAEHPVTDYLVSLTTHLSNL